MADLQLDRLLGYLSSTDGEVLLTLGQLTELLGSAGLKVELPEWLKIYGPHKRHSARSVLWEIGLLPDAPRYLSVEKGHGIRGVRGDR